MQSAMFSNVGEDLDFIRLNAIICFAPATHFVVSSSQYVAALAEAIFFVELDPVTLHL